MKSSPIYDKIRQYTQANDLRSNGLYLYMRKLESSSESHVTVNGTDLIMLASNNYLGLTTHPKVKEAGRKAMEKFGVGAGSVRLLGGTFGLHEELEARIAQFKGTESAIVYSSGYVSNLATLSTLLSKQTEVAIIDARIHASLLDGLRFAQIPFRVFDHNDMGDLEQKLLDSKGKGNLIIIVDGVYSMDGDVSNLPAIYKLAQDHGALVMVDDAHGTGVMGAHGRGTPEHSGLHGKIDIVMGTLSKGLGGIGGFAAGSRELIDFLKHTARGFVFSAALPPSSCAALLAAIQVIEEEPHWLVRLHENANLMRKGLAQMGYNIGNSVSAVIPVIVGEDLAAYQLARALHAQGVYVSPVAYPAVRKGTSRVRVSVMATHSIEDIMKALNAFENAKTMVPLLSTLAAAAPKPDVARSLMQTSSAAAA